MKYYPLCDKGHLPEVVILADGNFPRTSLAVEMLKLLPIVCCDGATGKLMRHGFKPQAIVGDGDSLSSVLQKQYASIIHLEKEQETNDLSKAFRFCLEKVWRNILILGATGKREDHTLGNISLLMDYMPYAQVQMLTDYGLFTPVCGDSEFESFAGQQVSVFNMGCTYLKGENLIYPLSPFTNWWQGTLNESTGTRFRVITDGRLLVYRADKQSK